MNKINFENLPSTNTPINATNLNQLQTNIENAITEVVDTFKGKVLWTDPNIFSPTFPAQTVTLNSTDFDYIIVYSYRNIQQDSRIITTMIEKTHSAEILYMDYYSNQVRVFSRLVEFPSTTSPQDSVTFSDCTINGTTNNAILKPYKIIGFKYE